MTHIYYAINQGLLFSNVHVPMEPSSYVACNFLLRKCFRSFRPLPQVAKFYCPQLIIISSIPYWRMHLAPKRLHGWVHTTSWVMGFYKRTDELPSDARGQDQYIPILQESLLLKIVECH